MWLQLAIFFASWCCAYGQGTAIETRVTVAGAHSATTAPPALCLNNGREGPCQTVATQAPSPALPPSIEVPGPVHSETGGGSPIFDGDGTARPTSAPTAPSTTTVNSTSGSPRVAGALGLQAAVAVPLGVLLIIVVLLLVLMFRLRQKIKLQERQLNSLETPRDPSAGRRSIAGARRSRSASRSHSNAANLRHAPDKRGGAAASLGSSGKRATDLHGGATVHMELEPASPAEDIQVVAPRNLQASYASSGDTDYHNLPMLDGPSGRMVVASEYGKSGGPAASQYAVVSLSSSSSTYQPGPVPEQQALSYVEISSLGTGNESPKSETVVYESLPGNKK